MAADGEKQMAVDTARSRCRGAAALLPEAKHQPRPSDPVLAHLRADDREQAVPHTHRAPRAEHGSNSQELPRRADAISKAGVRRLDTGRVVCHGRMHRVTTTRTTASSGRCDRRPARDRVGDPRCCSRWGCNSGRERRPDMQAVVGAGCYPALLPAMSDRQLPVDGVMRMPRSRSRRPRHRGDRLSELASGVKAVLLCVLVVVVVLCEGSPAGYG